MKKIIFSVIILCFFTSNVFSQVTYQKLIISGFGGGIGDIAKTALLSNDKLVIAANGIEVLDSVGNIVYVKKAGNTFTDVAVLQQDNFIVTGKVINNNIANTVLVKFNANGDSLWTKRYVDTLLNRHNAPEAIAPTVDKGFIIAGTITLGNFVNDAYVIKTDSLGNVLWTRVFDVGYSEYLYSIKQLSDGGYIAVGESVINSTERNVILIKLDVNGDLLWMKQYGGVFIDIGRDVIESKSGGFVIVGTTESFTAAGQSDILLIKTDAAGQVLFTKTYGSALVDEGYVVKQTQDEGFVIAARMQSPFGGGGDCGALGDCYDYFVIKTDVGGDTLWTKMYGGDGLDFPTDLEITSDNGFVIVGTSGASSFSTYGGTYIVKTDSLGNSPCNTYNTKNVVVGSPTLVSTNIITQTDSAGLTLSTSVVLTDYFINPAKDTVLCKSIVSSVSKTLNNIQNIVVYPNPGTYELNISANISGGKMLLYSIVGELLKTIVITVGETTINTTDLSVGTYIYSITNKTTNKTIYGKWIKN